MTKPKDPTPQTGAPSSENDRIEALERIIKAQQEESASRDALIKELAGEVRANALVRQKTGGAFDPSDPAFLTTVERMVRGKFSEGGIIRDGYIEDADKLEEPVILFTNKSGIYIDFIKRGNMLISLPDGIRGPLKFDMLYRDAEEDTMRTSYRGIMVVESKRLLEALKKDDRFGVDFMLDQKVLNRKDKNAVWSKHYNMYHRIWLSRDENLVLAEAKRLGINTSATMTNKEYREIIAASLADEAIAEEERIKGEDRLAANADQLLKSGAAQTVYA